MLDKAVEKFPQVGVRCIPMLCWTRQWQSSHRWVCDAYLCCAGQGSGKVPTGGCAMHTYVMLDKAVEKFPQAGLRCMCYARQGSRKVPTGGCAMHVLCWTRQWKSSHRWVCDAFVMGVLASQLTRSVKCVWMHLRVFFLCYVFLECFD